MLPPQTQDPESLSQRPGPPSPGDPVDSELDLLERMELFGAWLQDHRNAVTGILVVIVLGVGGYAYWRNAQAASLATANDYYTEARDAFEGALAETVPGSEERTKKLQEARAALEKLKGATGASAIRAAGAYLLADTYFYQGDSTPEAPNAREAAKLFAVAAAEAATPLDKAAAILGEATAHENAAFLSGKAEDRAAAIRAYDQVIAMGDDAQFLAWEARNGKGRVLLEEGKIAEAEKLFREVYDARWTPAPAAGADATPQQQTTLFVAQLRERLDMGSAGGYAREQLLRLGADVEALDAAKRAKPRKP